MIKYEIQFQRARKKLEISLMIWRISSFLSKFCKIVFLFNKFIVLFAFFPLDCEFDKKYKKIKFKFFSFSLLHCFMNGKWEFLLHKSSFIKISNFGIEKKREKENDNEHREQMTFFAADLLLTNFKVVAKFVLCFRRFFFPFIVSKTNAKERGK